VSSVTIELPGVEIEAAQRISEKLRAFAAGRMLIIGVSGGIDSAVTLYLSVKAAGPENVYALIMPDSRTTPNADVQDAVELVSTLGVRYKVHRIDPVVDSLVSELGATDEKAIGNMRARIRMAILYYYSNVHNGLVVGTGDRSEILLGYFTKHGDGGADVLPIGGLFKTQVRTLGRLLGLPSTLVDKPSSPRLWPGQTAEAELGLVYETADRILYGLTVLGLKEAELVKTGFAESDVMRVIALMNGSQHKRTLAPVLD
jgi:NAD+ synthase